VYPAGPGFKNQNLKCFIAIWVGHLRYQLAFGITRGNRGMRQRLCQIPGASQLPNKEFGGVLSVVRSEESRTNMSTMVSNLELIHVGFRFFQCLRLVKRRLSPVWSSSRARRELIVEQGKSLTPVHHPDGSKARVVASDACGREVILATMHPATTS
jgi:hypothetical protein